MTKLIFSYAIFWLGIWVQFVTGWQYEPAREYGSPYKVEYTPKAFFKSLHSKKRKR